MRAVSIMGVDAGGEAMTVGLKTWGTEVERRPNAEPHRYQS